MALTASEYGGRCGARPRLSRNVLITGSLSIDRLVNAQAHDKLQQERFKCTKRIYRDPKRISPSSIDMKDEVPAVVRGCSTPFLSYMLDFFNVITYYRPKSLPLPSANTLAGLGAPFWTLSARGAPSKNARRSRPRPSASSIPILFYSHCLVAAFLRPRRHRWQSQVLQVTTHSPTERTTQMALHIVQMGFQWGQCWVSFCPAYLGGV
jgi:hypothetical protein